MKIKKGYHKYAIRDISLEIKTGKTPPSYEDVYYTNGNINWYTPADIVGTSILGNSLKKITQTALDKKVAITYSPNTVLITCIGEIGRVGILTNSSSSNQQITGVLVNENIVTHRYFYYWLKRNQSLLKHYSNYAVIPILNNRILGNIPIYLPKIEIQNKTVSQLDFIQSIIDKRKRTIAILEEIKISTFLEIFGDPVTNPKKWEKIKIHSFVTSIKAGKSEVGINRPKEETEIGVLKISSVTYGDFKPEQNKAILNKNIEINKLIFPKKGDLLISRANTKELIGATSIVDKDYDDVFLPDKIWKLDLNLKIVTSLYLHSIFSNRKWRMFYTKDSTGAGGSMFNISQDKFKSIAIPIPNMEFQKEYEKKIGKINNYQKVLRQILVILETLYKLILQDVFNEKEVVNEKELFEDLVKTFTKKDYLDNKKRILYLIEALNSNKFKDYESYEVARNSAFDLLNDKKISQTYDEIEQKIKLINS